MEQNQGGEGEGAALSLLSACLFYMKFRMMKCFLYTPGRISYIFFNNL